MLKQSVGLCLFYYQLPPLVVALNPCVMKELVGFKSTAMPDSLAKVAGEGSWRVQSQ